MVLCPWKEQGGSRSDASVVESRGEAGRKRLLSLGDENPSPACLPAGASWLLRSFPDLLLTTGEEKPRILPACLWAPLSAVSNHIGFHLRFVCPR